MHGAFLPVIFCLEIPRKVFNDITCFVIYEFCCMCDQPTFMLLPISVSKFVGTKRLLADEFDKFRPKPSMSTSLHVYYSEWTCLLSMLQYWHQMYMATILELTPKLQFDTKETRVNILFHYHGNRFKFNTKVVVQ